MPQDKILHGSLHIWRKKYVCWSHHGSINKLGHGIKDGWQLLTKEYGEGKAKFLPWYGQIHYLLTETHFQTSPKAQKLPWEGPFWFSAKENQDNEQKLHYSYCQGLGFVTPFTRQLSSTNWQQCIRRTTKGKSKATGFFLYFRKDNWIIKYPIS